MPFVDDKAYQTAICMTIRNELPYRNRIPLFILDGYEQHISLGNGIYDRAFVHIVGSIAFIDLIKNGQVLATVTARGVGTPFEDVDKYEHIEYNPGSGPDQRPGEIRRQRNS